MNKDELGKRIKSQYEDRTRYFLPRRSYSIIRLDGKSFHNYTKDCKKPFDELLIHHLNYATICLLDQIQGAQFAYLQSDEISILMTDFETPQTCAWFDGNVQKITSVSSSILTGNFNKVRHEVSEELAYFDSRVFIIPDPTEVENYFIWRQQDATRNSIQMLSRSMFSHKDCHEKSVNNLLDMIIEKGKNWNDLSFDLKRGRVITKRENGWEVIDTPIFTKERNFLKGLIPKYE